MKAVAGVFASAQDAESAARDLRAQGLGEARVTWLRPGDRVQKLSSVPLSAAEQPGVGKAMGGAVGAAVGVAGGFELATIAAMLPGVGPVLASGLIGAAVLGLAGAGVGTALGAVLDNATTEGLPEDEIFVYEDALRQGRSVVIAMADDERSAASLPNLLAKHGADTIDEAREKWWIGLRDAEREHYTGNGKDFQRNETFYRLGFQAALHARTRCKEYDQVLNEMAQDIEELKKRYPNANAEEPFRAGYERGRAYYQSLCDKRRNGN